MLWATTAQGFFVDIDIFGLLLDAVFILGALLFIAGFLLTAATGSARPVKLLLWILAGIFTVLIVIGFAFTPFLIFLLFQIVALILLWFMCVVAGAVCGGGLYAWRHRRKPGERVTEEVLHEFVPLAEFCAREGIDEERGLARIRSGYYRGGNFSGAWYVHRSEQSQ